MPDRWSDCEPYAYLVEYYSDVASENYAIMNFLVEAFKTVPKDSMVLDIGSGPTVYSSIVAAAKAAEIHVCDYSELALAEVRRWKNDYLGAFDWTRFAETALFLEQNTRNNAVDKRLWKTRQLLTQITYCDILRKNPLGFSYPLDAVFPYYDVIISLFCLESAVSYYADFVAVLCNVVSLLKKGGILILGTVDHSDAALKIGDGAFPVLDIGYFDLSMALSSAGLGHIAINRVEPDRLDRQYQGLLLATSTRL